MFPDTCLYGRFFLFSYVELVPKICPHLSVTVHACIHIFHRFRICHMTLVYAYFNRLVERNIFSLIHVSLRLSDLQIQNLGNYIKNTAFEFEPLIIFL
jgi:hypothetical protein